MKSVPVARRIALAVGAAALAGMGLVTACSPGEKPAENPAPSSSPASPSQTVSPTEKAVGPGVNAPGGHAGSPAQNSFAPSVKARPAPTALPGNVISGG